MAKITHVASRPASVAFSCNSGSPGVLQVVASDERVAIAGRASAEPARLAASRVGMDQRQQDAFIGLRDVMLLN